MAGRFLALGRASAPASLKARCLAFPATNSADWASAGRWTPAGAGWRWAWAAAAVLALGVAAFKGSSRPSQGALDDALGYDAAQSPTARLALEVVDDPSVPLFHAVETFDRLLPVERVAWQGGGR